jgi:hypothetical protein
MSIVHLSSKTPTSVEVLWKNADCMDDPTTAACRAIFRDCRVDFMGCFAFNICNIIVCCEERLAKSLGWEWFYDSNSSHW